MLEALERADARFAAQWWHWFFFAQPDTPSASSLPIRSRGTRPDVRMGQENYADLGAPSPTRRP